MEYLRIVKDGSIYDWVDEENQDTKAPTVGYVNKKGIEELERLDAFHHPTLFKRFIEQEMRNTEYGYMLKKDLYEMTVRAGSLDYRGKKEYYHSLEDMKERYMFLHDRAYFVIVRDVNGNMIKDIYNKLKAIV